MAQRKDMTSDRPESGAESVDVTGQSPAMGMRHNGRSLSDTLRLVTAALAENRLKCAFQPVVYAQRPQVPVFHECLARVTEPDGSILPAASFIAPIEGHDVGRLVDRAMLRHALAVLESSRRLRLSVNLSATGLGDVGWLDILRTASDRSPGCADFLIVEITESAIMTLSDENIRFLNMIRSFGCSIAIDDFGAGHTSIGHFNRFRFDFLKIDGSFVRGLVNDLDNQFLVRAMASIARHFDMVSIAEMVSTEAEANMLRSFGVDCLQGFHIARPYFDPPWLKDLRATAVSGSAGDLG